MHRPDWTEEPLFQHNARNWKTLVYFVIGAGSLEASVFMVKTDHSLKAFGKSLHSFDSRRETIPGCAVNIVRAIPLNAISQGATIQVFIWRTDAVGRWNKTASAACAQLFFFLFFLSACTGTKIQVGGNGYIGTTTDHYTLQSSIFKAYLAYQSCCREHASPCPLLLLFLLLRVFVRLCLEQLDETSDAPLPNVTSSPSFWGNKLALS